MGEQLRPVYVLLDGDESAAGEEASSLSEEEMIALIQSEFGAEEVDADEPRAQGAEG